MPQCHYYRNVSIAAIDVGHVGGPAAPMGGFTATHGRYIAAGACCECIVTTPESDPDLWDAYLSGALRSYRKFGVERVLEYESVRTGLTTSMFVAILDLRDRVVGGVRVQGPYRSAEQAHALTEWNGAPGSAELRAGIAERIVAGGMVEMKTGWVDDEIEERHTLASVVARTPMHAMALTGAHYALCTVADHAVRRWCSTGARVSESVPAVAYPDDRYRTVPIWWSRSTFREHMDPRHVPLLHDEWFQITQSSGRHSEILRPAA